MLNNEEATFNICRSMKNIGETQMLATMYYIVESVYEIQIVRCLGVEALIMNFESDSIEQYGSLVAALE